MRIYEDLVALQPTMGHLRETSPRAADWRRVFGGLDVPVRSPVPTRGRVPGRAEPVELYHLDVQRLDAGQRERLVAFLAERFDLDPADVASDLDNPKHGLPLLAEDLSVTFDTRLAAL